MRRLVLGARLRRAGLAVAITVSASTCLLGCPSTDPDPAEIPPPVPGTSCEPNAQRCLADDAQSFEICRADGRGWFEKTCPTGSSCDPSSGTCKSESAGCEPGAAKCTGSPGTAARSVCTAEGTGWNTDSCAGDMVCDPSTGGCVAPVCDAGESRCDGGPADPDRSTCAPDRLSFSSTPCSDSAVCVATNDGSKCVTSICTPAEVICSSDHTSVLRCDSTGTLFELADACTDDEACQMGACASSQNPLGDVVRVQGPNGSLALSPGRYAVAVVNVDVSGDDMITYPVDVEGAVEDLPGAPAAAPIAPMSTAKSGTAAMLAHVPEPQQGTVPGSPSAFPADADEYVFQVPDYASGGTVVLTRTAKLRASGQHVNLWEDQTTAAPGSLLPDAVLTDLLARIDTAVIPRAAAMVGEPTDVDDNGKIEILFTDVLPSEVAAFSYPSATLFAPGSFTVDYDFGEVVYTHGLTQGQQTWEVATLMSHEIAQLIYLGRRMTPFLDDPSTVPSWVDADLYAVEGLASVAMGWSGQSWAWPTVTALENPNEMSLWRLAAPSYIQEPNANLASYGFGTLVQEYLFDQAGAMKVQAGGSVLEDAGGLAYVEAFSAQQSGWDRLAPLDGRPLSSWYVDFATALLLVDQESKVSADTASDTRYQFADTVVDTAFGGFIGPTLRYEHVFDATGAGAILKPSPWTSRPAELRRGGLSLVEFEVGDAGASLSVTEGATTVVVIRRKP